MGEPHVFRPLYSSTSEVTKGTCPLSKLAGFDFQGVFLDINDFHKGPPALTSVVRPELTCTVEGVVAIRNTWTQLTEITILLQNKHQSGITKDHAREAQTLQHSRYQSQPVAESGAARATHPSSCPG